MTSSGQLYVGPAGWSYEDWKGIVYPAPQPRGFDALHYIAGYFNCVEINSTFYRPPSPRVVEGWARRVEGVAGFRFTLKLWERFTHAGNESVPKSEVSVFKAGIEPLAQAGRLGAVLAQFPWFFADGPESREHLRRIVDAFRTLPLVLEVRHSSFATPDALGFVRDLGVGLCNIDLPLARDSLRPSAEATSSIGYVRLHGRNAEAWFRKDATRDERYDYLYSEAELLPWIERIVELRRKTKETFVVANNHFRGKAPANALQLRARLEGSHVAVPPSLQEAFPFLRGIAVAPETSRRSSDGRGLFDAAGEPPGSKAT